MGCDGVKGGNLPTRQDPELQGWDYAMALRWLSVQLAVSADACCSIAVHELGSKECWQPVLMDAAAMQWSQLPQLICSQRQRTSCSRDDRHE